MHNTDIDKINEFKHFLNNTMFNNIRSGIYNGDVWKVYDTIKDKFNELGLNDIK